MINCRSAETFLFQVRVVANYYAADTQSASGAFVKVQNPHTNRRNSSHDNSMVHEILNSNTKPQTMFRVNGKIVTDMKDIQVCRSVLKCDLKRFLGENIFSFMTTKKAINKYFLQSLG